MRGRTDRNRAIAKALTVLLPQAPYADTEAIREIASARKMRELPAPIAVWIATVTHVRHIHTEYDTLLAEGYDRDAARHFVLDEINRVLTSWRATRLLDENEADDG